MVVSTLKASVVQILVIIQNQYIRIYRIYFQVAETWVAGQTHVYSFK